jgi:hypothetical protein
MNNLLRWLMLFVCFSLATSVYSQTVPTGFAFAAGTQFRIKNTDGTSSPFYFAGTNNYYLMYKPMTMVDDVLNDMVYMNEKVVRMWFFMDGPTTHDGYALQTAAGVYSEAGMAHIDEVIAHAAQRGLKVLPVFVNYWSDFGGMPQYATWAGTNADNFYSDATCKTLYKNYVSKWLNRVNTVTGVAYKNDPTIFAWELTNEARCTSANMSAFVSWVGEMSTYIKGIDANHMITVGDEGFFAYTYDQITSINASRTAAGKFTITNDWPYAGSQGDWIGTLQLPNISFGTLHNYATDNWSYTQAWGENWTKYHIEIANQYNKPCIMEEYDKGYSGNWTTAIDQTRGPVISSYQNIIETQGMAGDMQWMLVSRNYTDPVQSGYTLDNTAPVSQIWLYRVLWSDGHQYSRYDPTLGVLARNHGIAMAAKNGSSTSNINPVAQAGSDQAIFDNDNSGSESVTLDGSGSFDPDGSIASYTWKEGATTLATVAKPTINLSVGTHNITLTVTDNKGTTGTDNVVVSVLSGASLIIEAESATRTGSTTVLTGASSSGTGYVEMAASPATIVWSVSNVPVSANYQVTFVTRSYGGTSANGSKVETITTSAGGSTNVTFAAASTWRSDVVSLPLNAGSNTITISANWGYIDVDYISVKGLGSGTSNTLTVSPASLTFTSGAGNQNISISSNVSWTASSNQTWLTLSPASGSNNGTVTATAAPNTGTIRTATVTITGGGITQTVSVTQAAPAANTLTVSPSSLTYTSASGSQNISVTSNVSWTASSNQTWLTLSPASGTNNGTVTATATANTGASRTANVTITGGGITRTVSVTQSAPAANILTVSPSSLTYASASGSQNISVTSNVSWTASSNQSWLTLSPASGSNNGTVTATATANTGTSSRTATVTITGSGITQAVNVTQSAPSSTGNLALNKSVTVSSTEASGNVAANAVDGNTSSRWASVSGVDPQWIYVDLGSTQTISRVKITWEAAYATSYQIQTSTNASTWTTVRTVSNNSGGVNDNVNLGGSGRYVRIYGTARNNSSWGYSIFELQVYATSPANNNLALNKPATASSQESSALAPAKAVDGSTGSRWASASGSNPQWIYIDLGATQTITEVKITWEAAYATSYQIQTSTNASTWTTIKTVTGNAGGVNDNTGLNGSGRYVRIYGTSRNNSSWGYSIFELEVYNGSAGRVETITENIKAESDISAYPNPVDGLVTVIVPERWQKNGAITLMNQIGSELISDKVKGPEHVFDMSNMSSGLYFIRVQNNTGKSVIKILKR